MKKMLLVVLSLFLFANLSIASENKSLESLVLDSFKNSDSKYYMDNVFPSYEQFAEVIKKFAGADEYDENETKEKFERSVKKVQKYWQKIKDKSIEKKVDWSKVKFLDKSMDINKEVTQKIGLNTANFVYINYEYNSKKYLLKLKDCVEFKSGWRCGDKLKVNKVDDKKSEKETK